MIRFTCIEVAIIAIGFNFIIVFKYSGAFLIFGSVVIRKSALNGEFFFFVFKKFKLLNHYTAGTLRLSLYVKKLS